MNIPDNEDNIAIDSPRVVRYEFQNYELPGFDLNGLRGELDVDWSQYEAECKKFDELDQRVLEAVFSDAIRVKSWKNAKDVGDFLLATEDKVAGILDGVEGVETFYYKLTQSKWDMYQVDESTMYDLRDMTVTCMQYYIWQLFRKRAAAKLEGSNSGSRDPSTCAKEECDFIMDNLFGNRLEVHFVGPVFKDMSPQYIGYGFEGIQGRIYQKKRDSYEPDYTRPEALFMSSSKVHKHLPEVVKLIDFHLCLPRTTYYELVIQDQLKRNGFYEEWKAWIHARGDLLCDPETQTSRAFQEFWGEDLPEELERALAKEFRKNSKAVSRFQEGVASSVDHLLETQEVGEEVPTKPKDEPVKESVPTLGPIQISATFPDEEQLKKPGEVSVDIVCSGDDISSRTLVAYGKVLKKKKKNRGSFRTIEETMVSQELDTDQTTIIIPEFERQEGYEYEVTVYVEQQKPTLETSKSQTQSFVIEKERKKPESFIQARPVTRTRVAVTTLVPDTQSVVDDHPKETVGEEISVTLTDVSEAVELVFEEVGSDSLQIASEDEKTLVIRINEEQIARTLSLSIEGIQALLGDKKLESYTSWTVRLQNEKPVFDPSIPEMVKEFVSEYLRKKERAKIQSFLDVIPGLSQYTSDEPGLLGTGGWNPGSDIIDDTIQAFCDEVTRSGEYRCFKSSRDEKGYLKAFTLGSKKDPQWSVSLQFDRETDAVQYKIDDRGVDKKYLTGVGNALLNFLIASHGNIKLGRRIPTTSNEDAKVREKLRKAYQRDLKKGNARIIIGDPIVLEDEVEPIIFKNISAGNIQERIAEARRDHPGMGVYLLYRRNTLEFHDSYQKGVVTLSEDSVISTYQMIEDKPSYRQILRERCHATLFNGEALYKDRTEFIADSRVREVLMEYINDVYGSRELLGPEDVDDAFVKGFVQRLKSANPPVPVIYISCSYATPQEHAIKIQEED